VAFAPDVEDFIAFVTSAAAAVAAELCERGEDDDEEDEEELLFAALLVGQFIPLDERLPTIQIKCSCAALSSGEDNNVTSIDIASGCCISRF
jgi:hypothetical protein